MPSYSNIDATALADLYRAARAHSDPAGMAHCVYLMQRMGMDVPVAIYRELKWANGSFD